MYLLFNLDKSVIFKACKKIVGSYITAEVKKTDKGQRSHLLLYCCNS